MSDTSGKIDPRAVQGLIDICMRYYPQLSTLEQMGVEQVAAQLEQHRQRQMLAGLPDVTPPDEPEPQEGSAEQVARQVRAEMARALNGLGVAQK